MFLILLYNKKTFIYCIRNLYRDISISIKKCKQCFLLLVQAFCHEEKDKQFDHL